MLRARLMWISWLLATTLAGAVFAGPQIGDVFDAEPVAELIGRVCAFGDLTGDASKERNTDILVVNATGLSVVVQKDDGALVPSEEIPFPSGYQSGKVQYHTFCTTVDFDGQNSNDILLVQQLSNQRYKADVAIRQIGGAGGGKWRWQPIGEGFIAEPSAFDLNGDGLADLLGWNGNGTLFCKLGHPSGNFQDCPPQFLAEVAILYKPQVVSVPPILADVTGDLAAELIVVSKSATEDGLLVNVFMHTLLDESANPQEAETHIWRRQEPGGDTAPPPLPAEVSNIGTILAADFSLSGAIQLLVPVCEDQSCQKVKNFLVWQAGRRDWRTVPLKLDGGTAFRLEQGWNGGVAPSRAAPFRVGDFLLDGYPVLLATVVDSGGKPLGAPAVLVNTECRECAPASGFFERKFERKEMPLILPAKIDQKNDVISTSAFFDLKEDGHLDILVEWQKSGQQSEPRFGVIRCDEKGDTSFLKVQVFTSRCQDKRTVLAADSCAAWPGACMRYTMDDGLLADGLRWSASCQVPMTSARALASPYALFGLGRAPNFVDTLYVGTPVDNETIDTKTGHNQQRHIVPNSRLVFSPPVYPKTNWLARLYLTPSKLIIQSLLVLMSVCVGLLIVACCLHFREKKEDRVERAAQSHRFHFDAM